MSELEATLVPVTWYCDDIHSGARKSASFGFPELGHVGTGWYYLGQVAVPKHQPFKEYRAVVVRALPKAGGKPPIKAPDFMTQRWEKTGHGGMCVVSYGCHDTDYVPIGDLYVRNYADKVTPDIFPKLACVRKDLLIPATYHETDAWDDGGSGALKDVSLWSVRDSRLVWSGDGQVPGFMYRAISGYPKTRTAAFQLLAPMTLDPLRVRFNIEFDSNGVPISRL